MSRAPMHRPYEIDVTAHPPGDDGVGVVTVSVNGREVARRPCGPDTDPERLLLELLAEVRRRC